MNGTVLQINVSRGGIPKASVPGGNLTYAGFEGDSWAHPKIHGGPAQAVLLIASEAIAALREKGYPVYPGALGENLSTAGLVPALWSAGQQYRVGEAVIELTKLREPCLTLDVYGPAIKKELQVKKGDSGSPQWAWGGFYARVIQPGLVFPGNPIRLLSELA